MTQDTLESVSDKLLNWYDEHGRSELPWRRSITPYRVWLSEIMLQQTQVTTVLPYFRRFIKHFPDVYTLAYADSDDVMYHWAGLGYYTRARNLHNAAQMIVDRYGGQFPDTLEALTTLPGVGRSTAGAVLAIAFKKRAPILDGNVKRILTRLYAIHGWPGQSSVEKRLWALSEAHTPEARVDDYTQAIMDLGATICLKRQPLCHCCPLQHECQAYHQELTSQIPTPQPAKQIPTKTAIFVILENEHREILFEKLPPAGVWGGMWCLPQFSSDTDLTDSIEAHYPVKVKDCQYMKTFKHAFSHFRLYGDVYQVKSELFSEQVTDTKPYFWYNPEEMLQVGLPKPISKVIGNYSPR